MTKLQKLRSLALRSSVAAGSTLAAGSALAATTVPVDTTGTVAQLGEINIAVAAVGGALLVAAAIAITFKWAKATIFG